MDSSDFLRTVSPLLFVNTSHTLQFEGQFLIFSVYYIMKRTPSTQIICTVVLIVLLLCILLYIYYASENRNTKENMDNDFNLRNSYTPLRLVNPRTPTATRPVFFANADYPRKHDTSNPRIAGHNFIHASTTASKSL